MSGLSLSDRKALARIEVAERVVNTPDRPACVEILDDHGRRTVLDRNGKPTQDVSHLSEAELHALADIVILAAIVEPDPSPGQRDFYIANGHWSEIQEKRWQERQARIAKGDP